MPGFDGLELGWLLNMKGIEARGAQLVGGANIVGGDLEGIQAALGLNLVGKHVRGRSLQLAFGGNIVGGNAAALQGAVGLNVGGGDLSGIQIAGGGNLNRWKCKRRTSSHAGST